MTDGFMDFTVGSGDENIGQTSKRFKGETGRTYRVSFPWLTGLDGDGHPTDDSAPRFTGCERIYKQGLGYVLITDSNRSAVLNYLGATPKQAIATVVVVWPTNKDGELDVESFKAGKGWSVQPWVFDPGKYREIGRSHKRFPLGKHDLSMACSDGQFQKMSFTPEGDNLLRKLLGAKSEALREVGAQILQKAERVAEGIRRDLARELTLDEMREKLGDEVASPTGNHSAKNVDDLLDDVI